MRILLVISKYLPEYTGAAFRIDSMYKRLYQLHDDLEIEILCGGIEYKNQSEYKHDGIPVNRIRSRIKTNPSGSRLFNIFAGYLEAFDAWQTIKHKEYDLMHVAGTNNLTATAIYYARMHNIPLLIELVTSGASAFQSLPGLHHIWKPDITKQTAVIAISEYLAQRGHAQGLTENLWCRPNPVDETRFYPDFNKRKELRKQLTPFQQEDTVLVSVAKFMPQKNQIFLIDVLARLPANYKLLLAGPLVEDGPLSKRDMEYMGNIKKQVERTGLQDRVHIVNGFVDMEDYVKLADVYCLPNISEGLGTPMLESLACGVPVVANKDEFSFRQWVREGEDGRLVNLVADEWIDAIKDASGYDENKCINSSKRILDQAGSEKIDKYFWKILTALFRAPPEDLFRLPAGYES